MDRIGPYTLLRVLGRGASGTVHAGRAAHVDREVAVKVLHADATEVARGRFALEARAAARLRHPGVVRVHDVGEEEGRAYLVMDLVAGPSLAARLDEEGPYEPREAVHLALQLAAAVEHAHRQGLLHRDLKPENILLAPDGAPIITDFGLAKDLRADVAGPTATGEAIGTPAYMAPEQARGAVADARTDVRALGAVLFAALTGRPPFGAGAPGGDGPSALEVMRAVLEEDAPGLDGHVDRDLATVIGKALERDPAARYPTAAAFAQDLERWLDDRPVLARRPTGIERLRRAARRHRTLTRAVTAALALALALAAVAGAGFVRRVQAERDLADRAAGDARAAQKAAQLRAGLAQDALDTLVYGVRERLDDVPGEVARQVRRRLLVRARRLLSQLGPDQDPVRAVGFRLQDGDLALETEGVAAATSAYIDALRLSAGFDLRDARPRSILAPASVRAMALDRLGEARRRAGDPVGACALLDEAFALTERLLAHHPERSQLRFNLVKLSSRRDLISTGSSDTPAALSARSRTLVLAFAAHQADPLDRDTIRTLAAVLVELGDVYQRRGELQIAAPLVESGTRLLRGLRRTRPEGSPGATRDLAGAVSRLAVVRRAQGDLAATRVVTEESLALVTELLDEDPTSAAARHDVVIQRCHLGDVLVRQGELQAAAPVLEEALRMATALVEEDPIDVRGRRTLITTLNHASELHEARGALERATECLRAAIAQQAELVALAPGLAERQRLGVCKSRLVDVLAGRGDLAGALPLAVEALALRRALAAEDPDNVALARDLVQALSRAAELRGVRGAEAATAAAELDEAVALGDALAARPGSPSEALRAAAMAHEHRGDLRLARFEAEKAAEDFERCRALRAGLVEVDPTSHELLHLLAISEAKLGDAERLLQMLDPARERYRASADRLARLGGPLAARSRRDRAVVLGKLSEVEQQRGDLAAARGYAAEAVEVSRARLADRARDGRPTVSLLSDLSHALVSLARVLLAASDAQPAVTALREAIELGREVVAGTPESVDARRALSSTLDQLGDTLGALDDVKGALAAYEESLAIVRALHERAPKNARANHDLALSLVRVGFARCHSDDPGGRALVQQGVKILEKVVAAVPSLKNDLEWAKGMLEGLPGGEQ